MQQQELTVEQQLQQQLEMANNQIVGLKSRILDAKDEAEQASSVAETFGEALGAIGQAFNVENLRQSEQEILNIDGIAHAAINAAPQPESTLTEEEIKALQEESSEQQAELG